MAFKGKWHETGFMFTRKYGRAHDVDVVSQRFDRLLGKIDLPRIRFHDYADLRVMPTSAIKGLWAGVIAALGSA